MKIAINAIPYSRWSGIEVFLFHLLKFWPHNKHDEIVIFANQKSAKLFFPLPKNIKTRIIQFKKTSRLRLFLFQQIKLPFILKKEKFDIIFCASLITPWLFSKKIITIHDAAPFVLKNETSFWGKIFWKINLFFSLLSSLKIITVSNFSKNELVKLLKIKPEKIEIISNGFPTIENSYEKKEKDRKYLVTIGNARPRKNLETLFKALNILKKENINLKLVIIGKMDKRMKKLEKKYSSFDIKFTGFINDKEKYKIINNAYILIFPSLYEGFGIPILEAGILKTPVICSDIPSFKEVAGDSAIFFNPKNIEELSNKIKRIIQSKILKKELGEKGYLNAQRFSWQKSAEKLSNIIHQYETPPNK